MGSRSPFAVEIDRVADQFEAEWKATGRPDPGDYLTRLPEAARPDLLIALVRVDVAYRQRAGEQITEQQGLREYRERYGRLPGLSVAASDPAAPTAAAPVVAPATLDEYQLVRELGVGGMGVVWLARDTRLDRDVAIKLLKPGVTDRSSERLLREARSAAKLSHPNVVSVYRVLERDGQICIVMERLGRSLSDELREHGRLPWLDATRAMRDATDGLAAAHAAALVHRDIKPSNLLRTARGDVKVADFGLVDSPDAMQLTPTGAVLGTPGYMAPEQCRGEDADARSDVYALGCTYYHLLTGRPPFEARDSRGVMDKHANDPFPDPRGLVPGLPDAVCHVIETACRKDPALRYASATQLLVDLEAILAPPAAEPSAPPLPAGGRLRIFISSPGDVGTERVLATKLVRRLSDEYQDRIWIEPVLWEHEPLGAHDTFQSQIPRPSESEIVVCILWSRLGTRLPAAITRPDGTGYASGTEYEFEDAVEGRKRNGYPDLLVYRKATKPMVSLDDDQDLERRRSQKKLLDAFIQKWFFGEDGTLKAAFHTFENEAAFEEVLEQHLRRLIARRAPAAGGLAAPAKPSWTAGSPFRGLQVFDFEHAPVYFGRTRAVGDLLTALRTNAAAGRAFALVVGVSGGGKSSLVRAGLLPLLVQPGVIEGVGLWRRAVLRPADSGDPMRSLAVALLATEALPELAADGTTAAELTESLRQTPAVAVGLVKGALSQAAAAFAREQSLTQQPDTRLVLVADQLEELFTLPNVTASHRQAFVAVLSALARAGKVWVVATLRGDFYHRCFELPELVALQEGTGQFALPLPTPAEIGQIIRQPARAAGLSFEEDPASKAPLDEVLREAAAASPESLPLLEFALEELYQRKTPAGLLTYAAYRELGGVEGALAQRAETVYAALAPDVQATLPRVMRALLTVGAGDSVARQQSSLETVAPTRAAKALVDAFVAARLFSADRTEQGNAVVRVAHEALLRNWPRVVQSLDHDRSLLIVRARVSAAAARWMADGKPGDLLLGEGKPLAEAERLAAEWGDELTPAERALIAASRARGRKRRLIAAAALLIIAAAGLWVRYRVVDQQNATIAAGLVRQVMNADNAQLPRILVEIDRYRQWANPLLRQENSKAAIGSRQRLHTSLALAPVDGGQVDYLYASLLNADPDEVPLIRDALLPHQQTLVSKLWSVVKAPGDPRKPTRLRAAAALALYDPQGDGWAASAALVVNDLVRENPVFLGQWSEDFRPIRRRLIKALGDVFRDQQPQRSAERARATDLLADYAADQPDMLADLLMDADEKQFAVIYPKLVEQKVRAAPVLVGEINRVLPPGTNDRDKEKLAKRQANAAVALMMAGQPAKTLELLRFSPDLRRSPPLHSGPGKNDTDPRARSYLIHRFATFGTDFRILIEQLQHQSDSSIRRALILSLGAFNERQISPGERDEVRPTIKDIYQTDADPGTHSAAEWLLQSWGEREAIDQPGRGEVPRRDPWVNDTNQQLARDVQGRKKKLAAIARTLVGDKPKPSWYVNGQGQTMVVIPGPAEFAMGSPPGEANRDQDEDLHLERIGRSFALDDKPVTVEQYLRFDKDFKVPNLSRLVSLGISLPPDLPVAYVNWYQAAAYCNWLSKQEGLPPEQWCYDQDAAGKVTRIRAKCLELRGYRLPTEAEMEYSTRAGTSTSRFFGETQELLKEYSWYSANSMFMLFLAPRPVGGKKPNDLGLFDVYGNVGCWCQESYRQSGGSLTDEAEVPSGDRSIRDSSFKSNFWSLRSAYRNNRNAATEAVHVGIRVAQSFPP